MQESTYVPDLMQVHDKSAQDKTVLHSAQVISSKTGARHGHGHYPGFRFTKAETSQASQLQKPKDRLSLVETQNAAFLLSIRMGERKDLQERFEG